MKEILQTLKLLLIFALYPLYFIGDAYNYVYKFNWSFGRYLRDSCSEIVITIVWISILLFGIL